MTESIHTGAWPRRVNPKLMLPLHTLTVLQRQVGALDQSKIAQTKHINHVSNILFSGSQCGSKSSTTLMHQVDCKVSELKIKTVILPKVCIQLHYSAHPPKQRTDFKSHNAESPLFQYRHYIPEEPQNGGEAETFVIITA